MEMSSAEDVLMAFSQHQICGPQLFVWHAEQRCLSAAVLSLDGHVAWSLC